MRRTGTDVSLHALRHSLALLEFLAKGSSVCRELNPNIISSAKSQTKEISVHINELLNSHKKDTSEDVEELEVSGEF